MIYQKIFVLKLKYLKRVIKLLFLQNVHKEQGAEAVFAACTHGLFTGGAVPKLLAGGIDRVLCTDTVDAEGCDVVSAAKAIAARLNL